MKNSRKSIIFVHLLNDFSGSPLVLSQVIAALPETHYHKILYTSRSAPAGFLSDLPGVETHFFWYKWQKNPWLRLVTYSLSQVILFFKLLRYRNTDATFYINTLLPFGAALAAKLMGKKVIYHLHESSISPAVLKSFLRKIAARTANLAIHVSQFLLQTEALKNAKNILIYNCLPEQFTRHETVEPAARPFTVLMICSLKRYKGVLEMVKLASQMPQLSFELLLNAGQEEIDAFFNGTRIPGNLHVFPATNDVHPFYQRASLLLNLSHPDRWVETFGMTVLEGMHYGIPAIVPPVGGITELVENGVNGYQIDVHSSEKLRLAVDRLAGDRALYQRFAAAAHEKSRIFSSKVFQEKLNENIHFWE